tara:strand:- start:69 stop:227 length:159 start_codon:yes stop_codon:yes gene_type:complete
MISDCKIKENIFLEKYLNDLIPRAEALVDCFLAVKNVLLPESLKVSFILIRG